MPIRRHVAFSRATPLHTCKARRSRDRSLFTSVSLHRAFAVSRQVRSCRVLASFFCLSPNKFRARTSIDNDGRSSRCNKSACASTSRVIIYAGVASRLAESVLFVNGEIHCLTRNTSLAMLSRCSTMLLYAASGHREALKGSH